jgi:peptide chain release factor 2
MLRARLYELEMQKREQAIKDQHDSKTDIGWGHQIRSYVLQPYQLVKDVRTNYETGDAASILNGDINEMLSENLKKAALK